MFLLLLILLVAMLPYGAVAVWAQALTGVLCMILAAGLFLSSRRGRRVPYPFPGAPGFHLFAGWLVLITVVHLARAVVSGTTGCLASASTALFLWCALACLASSARLLSGSTSTLRLLFGGIVAIATAQAVFAVIGLYTPLGIYGFFVSGPRAVGTFSSGNSLGGFLALSLPPTLAMTQLAFARAFQHVQVRRSRILHDATREDYCLMAAALWILAAIAQTIALLLSGSRGAIIATAVAIGLLGLWFLFTRDGNGDSGHQRLSSTAGILTALLLVLAIGAGGTYAFTVMRLKALDAASEVALPRTEIWEGALRLIRNHPLGVGPGGFPSAYPPFQPEGFGGLRVYHAHNDYLEIMAETGIPGLLLLVLSMGILLIGTARRLLRPQQGDSVWLRRSALLSVVAGCIHATVDFNLLSRPGVASLFFCLMGVAVSRHHQADEPEVPTCSVSVADGGRRIPGRRMAIAALCALLALNQLRLAASSLLMEQGFAAVTGEPSLYFWLPVPTLTQDQALARLRMARRLAPESVEARLLLARALVHTSDQLTDTVIGNVMEENPDEQALAGQVRILMRMDESRALLQARDAIDTATRLAPANPDVAADAALLAARLAPLASSDEDTVAEIGRALSCTARARLLAPNDTTVHRTLLDALGGLSMAFATVEHPVLLASAQAAARDIGRHLLQLGDGNLTGILDSLSRLHVDPLEAFGRGVPLPAPAAWALYTFYNKRLNADTALQALNLLEQSILADAGSSTGFRVPPPADIRLHYRPIVIRERARWALRQRRFEDYRQAGEAHFDVLRMEIDQALAGYKPHMAASLRFRYLDLMNLFDARGLDPEHTRELAALMRQHGESESAILNVLAPLEPQASDPQRPEPEPAHRLDMQLLGGRIEFMGLSMETNAIRTFWQFRSAVPSDLQCTFTFRDPHDQPVTSASFRFTQAFGRAFGAGNPDPGTVLQAVTPIPATAALSTHIQIGVRRLSSGRWLPSAEGLPYGEIHDWKTLYHPAPAVEPSNPRIP